VAAALLDPPSTLDDLAGSLVRCFEADPSGAALLLHAPPAPAGPFASAAGGAAAPAPALPRMPLALVYLASDPSYSAVASVARALGRLARRADPSGLRHLRRLFESLEARIKASQQRGQQQQQQRQRASAAAGGRRRGAGLGAEGASWQCECAAAVAVASEVVFGASGAWEAPRPASVQDGRPRLEADGGAPETLPGPGAGCGDLGSYQDGVPAVGEADAEFEALTWRFLEIITNERLWGQPTSQPPRDDAAAAAGDAEAAPPPLSAQLLGENALLLRALCDAAGAAARCLGRRFAGKPLRAALLPLLERLGDPCALVSDAAAGALAWVCIACGYNLGLRDLVGSNADYVIDGLCARLRALRSRGGARAAQLLAALLQRCGVAPELLPLMAEPLRGALSVRAAKGGSRAAYEQTEAPFGNGATHADALAYYKGFPALLTVPRISMGRPAD
jgi:hypothetical protein